MEQAEEFSFEQLAELIDSALGRPISEAPVQDAPLPVEQGPQPHLLDMYPSSFFAHLSAALHKHMGAADVTVIIDELRDKLLEETTTTPRARALPLLYARAANCTACEALVKGPASTPLYNLVDPDVVFILADPWSSSPANEAFLTLLQEAGFHSARLAITSLHRCALVGGDAARKIVDANCATRYLFAELGTLSPRLMVPLGKRATETLLGSDQTPFREVEGSTHWLGLWPVLPLSSPEQSHRSPHVKRRVQQGLSLAHHMVYGH